MPSYTLNRQIYSLPPTKVPLLKVNDTITLTLDNGAYTVTISGTGGGTLNGKTGRVSPTGAGYLLGIVEDQNSKPAGIMISPVLISPTKYGIRVSAARYAGSEDCVGEWEGPEDP